MIKNKIKNHLLKHWLIWSISLLAIIICTYLWQSKTSAIKEHQQIHNSEINNLVNNHDKIIDSLSTSYLKLTMQSLSWAVRGELIRGNLEQVEQYIYLLVKNKEINEANLINMDSTYWLSSNKKLEGQKINDELLLENLEKKKFLTYKNDSDITAIIPVMSLETQMGTLELKFISK
jgi:hypothetical protein